MPLIDMDDLDLAAYQNYILSTTHTLIARQNEASNSSTTDSNPSRPPIYKVIGLTLAIASGLFIGVSFVIKKVGLLQANVKYNEEAGEGYGYLKNWYWWLGMGLMIVGEICNFVAYAFTDAILVTPLGALSVVVTTILSAIFLKERLSFVGKVGCFNCIIGSVVIVLQAPEQSAVADIQQMKSFVIAPGFLSYAGVIIVGCVFIALWVGPRYGKSSMFVYLSICSLIGGLSVVATQGLGAAVIAQANKGRQFNQWFLYVLLVFVIATLLTEIVYLNKALNIFNAALVTPTYYVFFTSTTIITSAILFRGFHGTPIQITSVIMGFLQICAGVVLLQLSKSAKDVPDTAIFKGDLGQVREIAEQEHPESEPKADAIRGAASIIRRLSTPRRQMEQQEAKRLFEEKRLEHLEPLKENEVAEWDGLRRRKTIISGPGAIPVRRTTIHPPLGMTHFPEDSPPSTSEGGSSFFGGVRERAQTIFHPNRQEHADSAPADMQSPTHPVALTDIKSKASDTKSPALPYEPGSFEEAQEHIYGQPVSKGRKPVPSPRSKPLPKSPAPSGDTLRPPNEAKRQFSFTNMFRSPRQSSHSTDANPVRPPTAASAVEKKAMKNATEEERLGLVQGDSSRPLMADTSPQHQRSTSLTHTESPEETTSLYHNRPYSQPGHYHRSASPEALSDDGVQSDDDQWQAPRAPYQQRQHQQFSFSSQGPSPATTTLNISSQGPSPGTTTPQQRATSRRRPSPPAVYAHPPPISPTRARDFAQPPERISQTTSLQPPQQQSIRRVTIGTGPTQNNQQTSVARSVPSLDPPVQFLPTRRGNQELSPTLGGQSPDDATRSSPDLLRGRQTNPNSNPYTQEHDEAPSRSGESSNTGSKERFAEQSAREREERRARAQKRMSTGGGQSLDFS